MNNKRRKQLKKIAPLGGQATFKKYGSSHFSRIAKKQTEERMGGLTIKERSEMMSCVRKYKYGWRWNKEKRKCLDLGVAFGDNINK